MENTQTTELSRYKNVYATFNMAKWEQMTLPQMRAVVGSANFIGDKIVDLTEQEKKKNSIEVGPVTPIAEAATDETTDGKEESVNPNASTGSLNSLEG